MKHQSAHLDPLIPVLDAAHREGNPVPGGDGQHWAELGQAVRRRWNSYTRRHPVPASDTRGARIEDLARGLLTRGVSGGRTMLEISDCRDLARRLVQVLSPLPSTAGGQTGAARGSR